MGIGSDELPCRYARQHGKRDALQKLRYPAVPQCRDMGAAPDYCVLGSLWHLYFCEAQDLLLSIFADAVCIYRLLTADLLSTNRLFAYYLFVYASWLLLCSTVEKCKISTLIQKFNIGIICFTTAKEKSRRKADNLTRPFETAALIFRAAVFSFARICKYDSCYYNDSYVG